MADLPNAPAAGAASDQVPRKESRSSREERPLVYATQRYNLYDSQMTEICERFAGKYLNSECFGPADKEMFVDDCRDELAKIMETYAPEKNDNPYAYAQIRLGRRVVDILGKFLTRLRRHGRTVSLDAPSECDGDRCVCDSREVFRALVRMSDEHEANIGRKRDIERLMDIAKTLPYDLGRVCRAIMESRSRRAAARSLGISHQTLDEIWIPKLRRYVFANGFDFREECHER